jgi:hypothetical protein
MYYMSNSNKMKPDERIVRCPQCSKSIVYDLSNENRPFCSERCKLIDIGAWADEDYRVPGKPAVEDWSDDSEDA